MWSSKSRKRAVWKVYLDYRSWRIDNVYILTVDKVMDWMVQVKRILNLN